MKFLVVDDDPTIRSLLAEILRGHGYDDVVTATDGNRALQILKADRRTFDCLLLDIQMPGMDGIELCRMARRIPGYVNTPIIMITAMRDEPHITRAFAAGATDYTVKPFDVFELIERIRVAQIIGEPGQSRQLAMARPTFKSEVVLTDSLLSRAALENFTRTCRVQRHLSPAAIVVHVPPGNGIGVGEVATAIAETLPRSQVFSTYLGGGDFLSVCDQATAKPEYAVHAELSSILADRHRGMIHRDVHRVEVGCWSYPRAHERPKDLSFMDRAIANKQNIWPSGNRGASQTLVGRLLNKR